MYAQPIYGVYGSAIEYQKSLGKYNCLQLLAPTLWLIQLLLQISDPLLQKPD